VRAGVVPVMADFLDLGPAAARFAALLPGVRDDALDAPTPCAGTSVAALLSHVFDLAEAFRGAAEKAPDPGPPPAAPGPLRPDWRTALPARLDALATAWSKAESREGSTSAGGIPMPADQAAIVALDELVLHGWDLARATGQPYQVEPASLAACMGFVEAWSRPEGVPGLFGPPVPVPDDAPALDRLLGLSGRDPGWRPPV
jgi:uncharacterized protein (TIGR03086 family)